MIVTTMFELLAAALLSASPPQIDVYTMGTGDALFHRYGHAAICTIHDDAPRRSRCYNYGTTDFGSPPRELGWAFVRGEAPFWVSVWPLQRMLEVYEAEDRSVWRQRLQLPPAQAEAIAAKLEADAKRYDGRGPEASYAYHHFADNCTTRIRDIVDEASGGALSAGADASTGVSFREYGEAGLADMPQVLALGQLVVGRAADAEASDWQAMFLPRSLRARIEARLGARPEPIHTRRGPDPIPEGGGGSPLPYLLAFVALASAPALAGLAWPRRARLGAGISGALLGLIGLALWVLAGLSQMPELRYNEALLLFWPTDLILAALGHARRRSYARVRVAALLACGLGLALGLLRQPLAISMLAPLIVMLVVARGEAPPANDSRV